MFRNLTLELGIAGETQRRTYLTSRADTGVRFATLIDGSCMPGPFTRRSEATISSRTADTITARQNFSIPVKPERQQTVPAL